MPRVDPISSFSWLDFDEREAQQFRELVATLDEQETVDSLGLGSIRDTISDILFPGTSTIQTRARYFVLVPWAAQVVERRKPRDAKQFDNWLRQVELATLGSLIGDLHASGTCALAPLTTEIVGPLDAGISRR